jgi:hypothetical protein
LLLKFVPPELEAMRRLSGLDAQAPSPIKDAINVKVMNRLPMVASAP